MMGGGGGGGGGRSEGFLGSEILAQRDVFGSVKDTRIFLSCEKKHRDCFGYGIFISSNQQ